MKVWTWVIRGVLLLLLLELFFVLRAHSNPLRWWRIGYKCCSADACARQRMHTRIVVRD